GGQAFSPHPFPLVRSFSQLVSSAVSPPFPPQPQPPVPRAAATGDPCWLRHGVPEVRRTAGARKEKGGVARTRHRGGSEAQMQTPSTSTGVEAESGVRLVTASAGRNAPPRSSTSMATKRKLDSIDPASSLRRMTRAATKLQKHDGPKPSQRRTGGAALHQ
ncbi:unnamed protein product, partial [Urochloa humidicola]